MSQSANNVLKAAARAHCDRQTFPPADTHPHVRTRCYDAEYDRLKRDNNPVSAPAPTKKAGTFFMIFIAIAVVVLIGYTMMSPSKKSGKNNLKISNRANASKLNLKNK